MTIPECIFNDAYYEKQRYALEDLKRQLNNTRAMQFSLVTVDGDKYNRHYLESALETDGLTTAYKIRIVHQPQDIPLTYQVYLKSYVSYDINDLIVFSEFREGEDVFAMLRDLDVTHDNNLDILKDTLQANGYGTY